jgi:RimJ/RimL family protein N-acetyltransferase
MLSNETIEGKFVVLRPVQPEDARFILSIRIDDKFNKFINKTDNNIEKQMKWLKNQQAAEGDFYFIITNKKGDSIGTISLYNVSGSNAEFGRWICKGNSLEALESVILLHDFGFYRLGLSLIFSGTNTLNKQVINFHKNFGAIFSNNKLKIQESGIVVEKAVIKKADYSTIRKKNYKLINNWVK